MELANCMDGVSVYIYICILCVCVHIYMYPYTSPRLCYPESVDVRTMPWVHDSNSQTNKTAEAIRRCFWTALFWTVSQLNTVNFNQQFSLSMFYLIESVTQHILDFFSPSNSLGLWTLLTATDFAYWMKQGQRFSKIPPSYCYRKGVKVRWSTSLHGWSLFSYSSSLSSLRPPQPPRC